MFSFRADSLILRMSGMPRVRFMLLRKYVPIYECFGFRDEAAQNSWFKGILETARLNKFKEALAAAGCANGHVIAQGLLAILLRLFPELQRTGLCEHVVDIVERRLVD